MNKYGILLLILLIPILFVLGFGYKKGIEPNSYYQVYLNDEVLGIIKSKSELETYIDAKGNYIKEKYGVKQIYSPLGLQIKKISTYSQDVSSVETIYKKIKEKAPFTIKGYQFKIKKKVEENGKTTTKSQKIYVLKEDVFTSSVETLINTFVGTDEYKTYKEKTQNEIETTGNIIENIYINEDITEIEKKISIEEKIYTNKEELSKYLLFGKNKNQKNYIVKNGDTLTQVALDNKVSVEEILISNEELNSANNLLFPGQEIVIKETDPQLSVVAENYNISDIENDYNTEEKYNDSMIKGDMKTVQEGQTGLERVTQRIKKINGNITFVNPISKETLKQPITKIVEIGNKIVSGVGSTTSWGWPSESGWTLSSDFGWRSWGNGTREFHQGLDLSGTGYGSKIYASNNGVVSRAAYRSDYGNMVIINHNNGYFTVYAHMSRIAQGVKEGINVERGQVIGYVGATGQATGPHLHFEVWKNCEYCRINPWSIFR